MPEHARSLHAVPGLFLGAIGEAICARAERMRPGTDARGSAVALGGPERGLAQASEQSTAASQEAARRPSAMSQFRRRAQ